jgi:hypothetical protein
MARRGGDAYAEPENATRWAYSVSMYSRTAWILPSRTVNTPSVPGPDSLAKGAQAAQTKVQRAAAAVKAPMHALRGTGEQERMLKNALTEFQDEAEEIATYRLLDALATSVGDKETAKLAKKVLREEERMAEFLGDLIPKLAVDVAHDEIPVAEIEGPAARRTARDGGGTSRRTTRSRASSRGRS